jgi:hypothetical protein
MATPQTAFTINGTEYNSRLTYRDAHNSFWQGAGRRTDEGMPLMETEAYYGEEHVDGMDVMPLDQLIAQYGPLKDADPDLEGRTNEVAQAIRVYRNSIRNLPSRLSPGRASAVIGRLQAGVEALATQMGLSPHEPLSDDD